MGTVGRANLRYDSQGESQAPWQLLEEEAKGAGKKPREGGAGRKVRKITGFSSLPCPGPVSWRHVFIFPIC